MPLLRVTLFKIPDPTDVEKALAAYETLKANSSKDGKPYIIQQGATKLYDDARSQGYTVSARTIFESLDDMKYYDESDKAHDELKGIVKPLVKGGPPLVIYTDVPGRGV